MAFVVFEGIDGVGKSTVAGLTAEILSEKVFGKKEIILTSEPSGSPIGILLGKTAYRPDPLTAAYLFAADRVRHLTDVIFPALRKEAVVLCDRYIPSSIVYQGFSAARLISSAEFSGAPPEKIAADPTVLRWMKFTAALNMIFPRPSFNILLDAKPETAFERIKRRDGPDEPPDLLYRAVLRHLYLKVASDPFFTEVTGEWLVIDTEQTGPERAAEIIAERILGIPGGSGSSAEETRTGA